MFLDINWYWWIIIIIVIGISIPLKIKFINLWNKHQQEKKKNQHEKWGDDE